MSQRFISKRPQNKYIRPIRNSQVVRSAQSAGEPTVRVVSSVRKGETEAVVKVVSDKEVEKVTAAKTDKKENKETDMDNAAKITQMLDDVQSLPKRRVKVEKKDKGLIERTENSTILITEDNKMLLND